MSNSEKAGPSPDARAAFRKVGGTKSHVFNLEIAKRTLATAWPLDGARKSHAAMVSLATVTRTALAAFEPADGVEGMLSGQAVALHNGTMESLRRAALPDQSADGAARCRKDAASLSRAMIETIDALKRWRESSPKGAERDGEAGC